MRGCPCQGLVCQHNDISRPPLLRIQESVRLRALAPMHLCPGGEAEPHRGKQFLHSILWPANAVGRGAEKWDTVLEHGAGISAPPGIPALAVKSARGSGSQSTARTTSVFSKEAMLDSGPGRLAGRGQTGTEASQGAPAPCACGGVSALLLPVPTGSQR